MLSDFERKGGGRFDAKGRCPHCNRDSNFSRETRTNTVDGGDQRAYTCASCESLLVVDFENEQIYPGLMPRDLPEMSDQAESVEKLYEEGLRCISVNAPNGALTCFRKTIHSLAIHYDIVEREENAEFWELIDELHSEGHITDRQKEALSEIRETGADGAHENPNIPDEDQAIAIKDVLEAVIRATVVTDMDIERAQNQSS